MVAGQRGYTANHGICFVISAATDKALDYKVISKVCNTCTLKNPWMSKSLNNGLKVIIVQEMECTKRLWGSSWKRKHDFWWGLQVLPCYLELLLTLVITMNLWNHQMMSTKLGRILKIMINGKNEDLDGSVDWDRVIKLDYIGHIHKHLGKAMYEFLASLWKENRVA